MFVQPKWRIARDKAGSGNTKNIGGSTSLSELLSGTAMFSKHENGKKLFNSYWINFQTPKENPKRAYSNLEEYLKTLKK